MPCNGGSVPDMTCGCNTPTTHHGSRPVPQIILNDPRAPTVVVRHRGIIVAGPFDELATFRLVRLGEIHLTDYLLAAPFMTFQCIRRTIVERLLLLAVVLLKHVVSSHGRGPRLLLLARQAVCFFVALAATPFYAPHAAAILAEVVGFQVHA